MRAPLVKPALLFILALGSLLSSRAGGTLSKPPIPAVTGQHPTAGDTVATRGALRIAALLEGRRIAVFQTAGGAALADRSLGDSSLWNDGSSLGVSPTGDHVFATLVARSRDATAIVRMDLADYVVQQTSVISDSIPYPWLAVGPRSGRLFIASGIGFRIAVVAPARASTVSRYSAQRDTALYRQVTWFGISPDERRVFVSYHGAATGGDWMELRGASFVACNDFIQRIVRVGCVSAHGRIEAYGRGFAAATGQALMLVDSGGNMTRRFDTGLGPRVHFMEFVSDFRSQVAYAIAPCHSGDVLSRISLADSTSLVPAFRYLSRAICGDRIVASNDAGLLAVLNGASITIVDSRTGAVVSRITTPARVLDVVFIRG